MNVRRPVLVMLEETSMMFRSRIDKD